MRFPYGRRSTVITEVHKPNPKLLEEIYAKLNLGDKISVHFFDGDTIIGRFLGVDLWGNHGDCIDVHVPDGLYYTFYLDEIASFDLVERYEDSPTANR